MRSILHRYRWPERRRKRLVKSGAQKNAEHSSPVSLAGKGHSLPVSPAGKEADFWKQVTFFVVYDEYTCEGIKVLEKRICM